MAISGNSSVVSSVYGDANNRNDIQIQVNETVSDKLSSYAGILYSDNDYEGLLERVDGSLILFAGYFFHFNKHSFWNARIQYEDRSSTVDGLGFDRLFGSIGVSSIW